MCDDLVALFEAEGLDEVILVGHSMGGKLAMEFAMEYPQRVTKLVIVDIAPVRYSHDFADIFSGIRAVRVSEIEKRSDAEQQMAEYISEPGIRQFLLQNLVHGEAGWRWRINLDWLQASIPSIQAEPPSLTGEGYRGPVSVIYGEESDYVQPAFQGLYRRHFPEVAFNGIAAAGHWTYAEQPESFMQVLSAFLAPE